MRYTFALAVALCGTVWALPSQQIQSELDKTVENIDSRRGIEVGGNIKSLYLSSGFKSDQDVLGYSTSPDKERTGFSQLDLRFGMRPWAQTRANLILRLQAGYQDYFNAGAKSISVPWTNIEGQMADQLYWTVGDFRQQYSPLALYSPDVEIMYEPEIYRRNRYMARDQVMLKGNQRNLQGANVQFRDNFGEQVGDVRAEALFSRLRRVEPLDLTGAMGNILPNDSLPGASQASGMDKLLYGGNFEVLPMQGKLLVGLTPLFTKDLKSSTTGVYRKTTDEEGNEIWEYQAINPNVLGADDNRVLTARFGVDGARFLDLPGLQLDLVAEYGMSTDQAYSMNEEGDVLSKTLEGKALLAQITAGYQDGDVWMARMGLDYLINDSSWFNTLAQSPSFFARRIANSDKDSDVLKYGVRSPFYSTFDALYHFDPKFSPVSRYLVADPTGPDQTESYNIAPFNKNSWGTAVYTRDEMALVNALSDASVQSALPNGLATANRVGPRINVKAGYGKNNAVEMQLLFTMLQEASAAYGSDKAKFGEMGGGARVDAGSLIGWELPLEVSGSYKKSSVTRGALEYNSDFINTGIYGRYHKRFGVALGLQMINSTEKNDVLKSFGLVLTEGKQMQWKAGVDYSLAPNAWLALNYGIIKVQNTYSSDVALDALDDMGMVILPDYITSDLAQNAANYAGKKSIEHSFDQNQIEASINVDF